MGLQIVFEVWSGMYMYTVYDERKEFEKKFEEDLKFYNDATIKEMIKLYE